jgi:hypothetical protein
VTALNTQAGTEKRRNARSTEQRNTVTMSMTATQDATFDWREVGAQAMLYDALR